MQTLLTFSSNKQTQIMKVAKPQYSKEKHQKQPKKSNFTQNFVEFSGQQNKNKSKVQTHIRKAVKQHNDILSSNLPWILGIIVSSRTGFFGSNNTHSRDWLTWVNHGITVRHAMLSKHFLFFFVFFLRSLFINATRQDETKQVKWTDPTGA